MKICGLVVLALLSLLRKSCTKHCGCPTGYIDKAMEDHLKEFEASIGLNLTDSERASNVHFMKPGCGVPDNPAKKYGSFSVAAQEANVGWTKKALTYKIATYPQNSSTTLSHVNVDDGLKWAFTTWTWSIDLAVTKASGDKADFKVYFKDIDGPGNTLAYAYYPPYGQIVFDDSETWWAAIKDGHINFHWVALHEIGHALGLAHSDNITSIMFKDYQDTHPTPSSEDWVTIGNIYDAKKT